VLVVLFGGLKASSVAWTTFMDNFFSLVNSYNYGHQNPGSGSNEYVNTDPEKLNIILSVISFRTFTVA
jgi:hypothetical protein